MSHGGECLPSYVSQEIQIIAHRLDRTPRYRKLAMAIGLAWSLGIASAGVKEVQADKPKETLTMVAAEAPAAKLNVLPGQQRTPESLTSSATTTTIAPETSTTTTTLPPPSTTIPIVEPAAATPYLSLNDNLNISQNDQGVDLSWPPTNCDAVIPPEATFGIVGVSGGSNFTSNDCLVQEASQFNKLSLYVNTGYQGLEVLQDYPELASMCADGDENCIAYNYGVKAGQFALEYAFDQKIYAQNWWLDIETENSWSENLAANTQALQGEMDGITLAAASHNLPKPVFGFYSTPNMYGRITGGWLNGLPSWVATGHKGPENAMAHCQGYEFTGGTTVVVQYVDDEANLGRGVDSDLVC